MTLDNVKKKKTTNKMTTKKHQHKLKKQLQVWPSNKR